MSDPKNVTFNLKAMVNKEKSKVLFVEAGGDFVDVLLSFLTMPLGKVVKVLEKHYGVESPAIGSITTLYKGFMNLHGDNFWTEGAKQKLLNPVSSFEAECRMLKLDITDSRPLVYFSCPICNVRRNYVVSMYYDAALYCCGTMRKGTSETKPEAVGGVFTQRTETYIISDDLHLFPEVKELIQTITILGITDMDGAELMNLTLGINEIMGVLKASIFSPTPLSDIIFNQKRKMSPPAIVKSEHGSTSSNQMKMDANSNSKKMSLKVIVQKSSNKILYGRAGEDFIDFLSSFLIIPLGGILNLLGSESCFKSINNLYKSTVDLIDCKFFRKPDMKTRFTRMKLAHGSISDSQILPFTEENLSLSTYRSENFPRGQGKYVRALRTYIVADDLTVTLFSMSSTISMLRQLNISLFDIKEVELQIGLTEALSILRASLSSTSVLTDALNINPTSEKQPKQENA